MSSKESLSIQIEQLRKELNSLITKTNNLTSPEVIKLSQDLDEIIVQYNYKQTRYDY